MWPSLLTVRLKTNGPIVRRKNPATKGGVLESIIVQLSITIQQVSAETHYHARLAMISFHLAGPV